MHFLITGHTGFKGSWLSLLLHEKGHEVSGIALEPDKESLFIKADLGHYFSHDIRCDVRDYSEIETNFKRINPDVVIHMAAQALVRESYKDPTNTFEINSMGTINVLKASQAISNLQAQLIITTDKVYKNVGKKSGYKEDDALGGVDPYSASKAMADIAAQSWMNSFANAPTAIARAGNVIGGGDYSVDRLIPDLVRSFNAGTEPKIRFPNAVRPWQHVLDCLAGYLRLIDSLLHGDGVGVWNFGPENTQEHTVEEVVKIAHQALGLNSTWKAAPVNDLYEADSLILNSEKARNNLNWENKLNFEESVYWAAKWYKSVNDGKSPLSETLLNIKDFHQKL